MTINKSPNDQCLYRNGTFPSPPSSQTAFFSFFSFKEIQHFLMVSQNHRKFGRDLKSSSGPCQGQGQLQLDQAAQLRSLWRTSKPQPSLPNMKLVFSFKKPGFSPPEQPCLLPTPCMSTEPKGLKVPSDCISRNDFSIQRGDLDSTWGKASSQHRQILGRESNLHSQRLRTGETNICQKRYK